MKNKRIALFTAIILILTMLLAGCGGSQKKEPASGESGAAADKKLQIVATIFPVYDWARAVAGDRAELTLLQDNGADLHNYQPTADDIVKLSQADVFIHVGGTSDQWVEKTLASADNAKLITVDLMDSLADRVKAEEVKDGMEAEEAEEAEEEVEYDEHIWLSLKNAATLVERIAQACAEADPAGKETYERNAEAYIDELTALDTEYADAVSAAPVKTLVFGDRFPFRYLVDDYGLDYYAAFVGCSTESEAKIETRIFLANKIDELGLKHIMQIETARGDLAEEIRKATKTGDQTILTLNSMQSIGSDQVRDGATYLGFMRDNLDVLKEALGN